MEHTCILAEQIGKLLFEEQFSDVALNVGGDVLPAHKVILASSCDYFRYLVPVSYDFSSQVTTPLVRLALALQRLRHPLTS